MHTIFVLTLTFLHYLIFSLFSFSMMTYVLIPEAIICTNRCQ